ncbi:MAG: hypothetical protein KDD56_07035 [Bdellovibrionales bacterium]|nr:hypothetical protein [Bdellovibrionales bacterium]
MRKLLSYFLIIPLFLLLANNAFAINVKAKIEGENLLLDGSSGDGVSDKDNSQRAKAKGKSARVFLRDSETGSFDGPIVVGIKLKKKVYTYSAAVKKDICSGDDVEAILGVKKGRPKNGRGKANLINLGKLQEADNDAGFFYTKRKLGKKQMDLTATGPVDENCTPTGNANNLGLIEPIAEIFTRAASDRDTDGDGLPNVFDADADNDGILNAYDPDFSLGGDTFGVFSNLKVNLNEAVNTHAGTITDDQIDSLLINNNILAIEVLSDVAESESSELNCGSLNYCSTGGTGETSPGGDPFPGTAGGSLDSDSDGFGTITKGDTGDFQLATGANSSEINGGDTYIQIVNEGSGGSRIAASMLMFRFETTPTLKSYAINGGAVNTISHPVGDGDSGTADNCFSVPNAGAVEAELVAWRPQRKGLPGAGEAELVDLGNSKISIDIPDAPCTGAGICTGGGGPGLCASDHFTTTDTNLTVVSEALQDALGDKDADPSNTLTFKVDLVGCLNDDAIAWNAGEKLFVDLQMRNDFGDNAAVKFCFQRAP